MQLQQYTRPFNIFLLMLPCGIIQGFVFVTLPYVLTHNGFSVAQAAAIVAVGASASLFRFVLGPVVDVSFSLRKWYLMSIFAIVTSLLIISFTSLNIKCISLITTLVFISQIARNIMVLPVGAFMAKSIEESQKGKASGWYQAGSLAGNGLGGGAGLWLAEHYQISMTGLALALACIAFSLIVFSLTDITYEKGKKLLHEITGLGKDLLSMLKVPVTLYAIVLIIMPIGTGAMRGLWSAMADDWKVNADSVALTTGLISGIISAVGCLTGGYIADRWGIWISYLGGGLFCAIVTFIMAVLPMQPAVYIVGVLFYAFTTGMIYAAFTAVLLFIIGKQHVATKFSLMGSLGNISVVYMTTFDGWMHDNFNSKYMLLAEAFAGIVFVVMFTILLQQMRNRKLIVALK